jgi:hypothetical protein
MRKKNNMESVREHRIQIVLYLIGMINLVLLVGFLTFFFYLVPFGDYPPFLSRLRYETAELLRHIFNYSWLIVTPVLSFIGVRFRKLLESRLMVFIHIAAIVIWCPVFFLTVIAVIR